MLIAPLIHSSFSKPNTKSHSAAEVALARTINVPEVTTAMVTSAYIDLVVDPNIFSWNNRSRNRRVFFVASLLVGSFIGAIAYRYVGSAFALLLSAVTKTGVCVAILFNKSGETGEQNGEEESAQRNNDELA